VTAGRVATASNLATAAGTITFCDIAGFTRFTREQGDEAALALLEVFDTIVRESLPAEGRFVKSLGDGALTFVPDPGQALRASLAQQRRFAELASSDLPLWVRTGMHYGSAIARGDDLVGHDVNLASRIADQAVPGEVLATASVLAAGPLAPGLRASEIGPVFVKGVDDAVRLFRIEAVGDGLSSSGT
jgi:class 3 adenylate cyclase